MKVLLVDDHLLFLQSVEVLFEKLLPDVSFEFQSSLENAHKSLRSDDSISVAIVDFHMPGSEGVDTISNLIETYPHVKFAVITGRMTRAETAKCVRLGVSGIIFKEISSTEIVDAVKSLLRGGIYLPESLVFNDYNKAVISTGVSLTAREEEVLRKIHEGLSNKEVARNLDISEVTVKMHVTSLLKKYKVKNRTELAVKCTDDLTFNTGG